VLVFLQAGARRFIPIVAIPYRCRHFRAMSAAWLAINNLTLFGLVLAVGIVVDDAIVVVEKCRATFARRHEPARCGAAHHGGGRRGAGPIALVLCAGVRADRVLAAYPGCSSSSSAVTIAVATAISASAPDAGRRRCSQILVAHEDQRPPARWNLIGRAWEKFTGVFNRGFRPAVSSLRRRRRLRDPASGGDAAGLCRADRQRRWLLATTPQGYIPRRIAATSSSSVQLAGRKLRWHAPQGRPRIEKNPALEYPGIGARAAFAGLCPARPAPRPANAHALIPGVRRNRRCA